MALTCPECENAGVNCTCPPKEVDVQVWHKTGGGMMVNTSYLPPSHAMHPYNQIKNLGLNPADYGMEHPLEEEFKDKSRTELIAEIIELKSELLSYIKGGM